MPLYCVLCNKPLSVLSIFAFYLTSTMDKTFDFIDIIGFLALITILALIMTVLPFKLERKLLKLFQK